MIEQFTQIPPPDERWYIVYPKDKRVIRYGLLTNTECDLGHNYSNEEIFENKELWIARLLELGIEYVEEV